MLRVRAKNSKNNALEIEDNQHLARGLSYRIKGLKLSLDVTGLGSRVAGE